MLSHRSVQIKSLEFVDHIADLNSGNADAVLSNDIICNIQRRKGLKFSTEKCRLLKVRTMAIPSVYQVRKWRSKRVSDIWVIFSIIMVLILIYVKRGQENLLAQALKLFHCAKRLILVKIKSVKYYYSITQSFCPGLSITVKHRQTLPVKTTHA